MGNDTEGARDTRARIKAVLEFVASIGTDVLRPGTVDDKILDAVREAREILPVLAAEPILAEEWGSREALHARNQALFDQLLGAEAAASMLRFVVQKIGRFSRDVLRATAADAEYRIGREFVQMVYDWAESGLGTKPAGLYEGRVRALIGALEPFAERGRLYRDSNRRVEDDFVSGLDDKMIRAAEVLDEVIPEIVVPSWAPPDVIVFRDGPEAGADPVNKVFGVCKLAAGCDPEHTADCREAAGFAGFVQKLAGEVLGAEGMAGALGAFQKGVQEAIERPLDGSEMGIVADVIQDRDALLYFTRAALERLESPKPGEWPPSSGDWRAFLVAADLLILPADIGPRIAGILGKEGWNNDKTETAEGEDAEGRKGE